jgi:hypothetical protein
MVVEVEEVLLDQPQQMVVEGRAFPKIFQLRKGSSLEECNAWVRENRAYLEEQLVLHGAFIFRGFPINEIPSFHDFLMSFGWDHSVKYTGQLFPSILRHR